MYQRVLLPLDGSELAEVALSYAKGIASRLGLELLLLHVAGKGEAESLPLHQAYIDQTSDRLRREMAEVQGKTGGQPVVVSYTVTAVLPAARTQVARRSVRALGTAARTPATAMRWSPLRKPRARRSS